MNATSRIERTDGIFTAPVDQDLVLMTPALDRYLALDLVGRRIWDILEAPRSFGELADLLAREYDATAERIAQDVIPFLVRLEDEGLVRVVEG